MRFRRVLLALATMPFFAFVAAMLLAPPSGSASPNPSPSAQASSIGEWSAPVSWPGIAVHAALLPTGNILTYSYPQGGPGSAAWLWDPTTDSLQSVPPGRNVFCSASSFLADGRLLVTGGDRGGGVGPGIADTHIFDPFTEEWTRVGDMAAGRFYPTNVALADGRTLVFSGKDEAGVPNDLVEIYDPASGMQVVPGANRFLPLYPRMHLLPSGKVFDAGPQNLTSTFDPATVTWQEVGSSNYGFRSAGTSVLLPLQPPEYRPKILIVGGGGGDIGPATNTAEIIDLADSNPSWGLTASMNHARRNLNAVLLPDGKILVVGGNATDADVKPVLQAEIFDPATETWTTVASMQRPRVYHSTAILLPDGRVVAAGSDGEFTAELYSPPYLFQGPRPQISSAPSAVVYNGSFEISTPDAQDIAKVVLIRPSAVTHSVNMEQRYLELDFQTDTDLLTVQVPTNPNLAPPGYYMLFIVNSDGVPSEAMFIKLSTEVSTDPVGGIAELPEVARTPLGTPDSSGTSLSGLTRIAAIAGGVITLGGAAWYAWRRRTG